jgi:hypothetical protein
MMEDIDIEDEMKKWEESISSKSVPLKGEVILSMDIEPKESFMTASFDEPKARESKRTKETEIVLKKGKKRNKSGLF